ncbi:MAG: SMP-30/gluconolactonase/LRE family protein [SAR202 cluster bacterium]|jgi:gluconolactonase|nr:SMP-30/gluconolactonase/LRE family protein [SAR202 cluster bacterium]MDP6665095.1 SMP-30/gluconolactonase/LRE family protein [SAR202 cluster bacterium]MQG57452.1 SMP-30/gluconolactonase/LRE family protein [SAR202 cluster bacterium]MQG68618.1 SMP-30/gluconolactonase/LRE family protein [SAR202 cluster bacterium]HAL46617.1 gluconolactonase [Dehalococcoidia bacterium]|tara:strand:- start:540 stop:1448 length:909 start_codon:yes stop_codon:yes gene_type:complete
MSWNFTIIDGPYGNVTEGPAWDGSGLLFTYIAGNQILRFDPDTSRSTEFRSDSNSANGLMFDPAGTLFACEGGARRVVRYEADGSATVLTDGFEGQKLNIPNDLAIDPQGRVWFTDPFYEGAGGPWSEDRSNKELDHDSVYRLDPGADGSWGMSRVTFDTTRPNGLLFSLDHQTLYVAQSGRLPEEKRELRGYPMKADGSLGEMTVLHDFGEHRGIDGMVLDVEGNIVATAGYHAGGPGPAIYVFAPSGEVLETHPLPVDRPTNCSFGGEDLTTLYVTTGDGHLLRASTNRQGRLLYPLIDK